MTLPHAVLVSLSERSGSGYELARVPLNRPAGSLTQRPRLGEAGAVWLPTTASAICAPRPLAIPTVTGCAPQQYLVLRGGVRTQESAIG